MGLIFTLTSPVAKMVKSLPTMQETRVWSQGWEDLLEKEMGTHSSILAWKTPWVEEPGKLQFMGSQRVGHDWATSLHLIFTFIFKQYIECFIWDLLWLEICPVIFSISLPPLIKCIYVRTYYILPIAEEV